MTDYLKPPPGNPLTQIVGGIIAVAGMALAFVLGFVALAVIAGLVVFLVIVFSLRFAWLKRKWRQQLADTPPTGQGQPGKDTIETIEADYTVVSRRRDQ